MQSMITRYLQEAGPLLPAILVVAVALLASVVSKRALRRLSTSGHVSALMAGRLQRARRWLVILLTLAVLLQVSGRHENALAFVSAVLATLAIGFVAAWSLLSNSTGALLLLVFRPFRYGDHVEVVEPTNGTTLGGVVIDMNLMFTTLAEPGKEDLPDTHLHVPNNLFFQKLVRTRRTSAHAPNDPFFASPLETEDPAATARSGKVEGEAAVSSPPSAL